jgi:hypothetical protein
MALAGSQVAVDRGGGLDGQRDDAAGAALAAADGGGGRVGAQAEVTGLQGDDLAGARAGGEHQPHDGFVALVADLGSAAGLEQGAELVVAQGFDDRFVEFGRLQPQQRVAALLTLLGQPGREAPDREVP